MIVRSDSFRGALPDCPASVNVAIAPFSIDRLACWRSWLGTEELQRVSNYHKQSDQELFIARRGLARTTIGEMLDAPPSSIRFATETTGKLRWMSDDPAFGSSERIGLWDFSLSKTSGEVAYTVEPDVAKTSAHSVTGVRAGKVQETPPSEKWRCSFDLTRVGLVAIAVCESERVGVDIETIGTLPELEQLATQNLHPIELKAWQQIPQHERTLAYYHSWVVKEAFVKALGLGLSQPPNSILSEQALLRRDQGTVAIMNDDQVESQGRYWATSIGAMQRLAVVTLGHFDSLQQ